MKERKKTVEEEKRDRLEAKTFKKKLWIINDRTYYAGEISEITEEAFGTIKSVNNVGYVYVKI